MPVLPSLLPTFLPSFLTYEPKYIIDVYTIVFAVVFWHVGCGNCQATTTAMVNKVLHLNFINYCFFIKYEHIIGNVSDDINTSKCHCKLCTLLIGLIYTDEPVTRVFTLDNRIEMGISIFDTAIPLPEIIVSLAWYHNGTEVTSDGRISINNNGTSLIISNTVEFDAGMYEVKINSTNLNGGENCDKNIIPMLANLAIFAPVKFTLQESNLSTQNSEDFLLDYHLPAYQDASLKDFYIENILMLNVLAVFGDEIEIFNYLYKDGVYISDIMAFHSNISYGNDVTMQSLRITYNNTDDITGHYSHLAFIDISNSNSNFCSDWLNSLLNICINNYYFHCYYFYEYFPLFTLHWNIRSYGKLTLLLYIAFSLSLFHL